MSFDYLNGIDLASTETLPGNHLVEQFNKSQLKSNENFDLNFSNININNVTLSYDLFNENQINYDNESEKNNNAKKRNSVNKAGTLIINAADFNQPIFHIQPNNLKNEEINLKDLNANIKNDPIQLQEKSKNILFIGFKKLVCILVGITKKTNDISLAKNNALIEIIKSKSFVAFFVFGLTVILGLLYAFLNIWFAISNGSSQATKNSILREFTSIAVSLIWLLLGVLSVTTLYKIHVNPCMNDAITGKTKNFFKIPAWVILFILLASFYYCLIDNLTLNTPDCKVISIPEEVCHLKYYVSIVFTGVALFWIYLVAVSIMMITKNHTRLIRRLLKNIEIDTQIITSVGGKFINQEFAGPANEENLNFIEFQRENSKDTHQGKDKHFCPNNIEIDLDINKNQLEKILIEESFKNCQICWTRVNANVFLSMNFDSNSIKQSKFLENLNSCKHFMTTGHLLHFYSRILYLLRVTSFLLQRWTSYFILWTLLWCTKCLIEFTYEKNPSVTSLFQFILPFLILAVVCGVFTETNAEGLKLNFSISPIKERLEFLSYLKNYPLQIRLYGFVLDYGVEMQFIGVFAIGFLTQVIFHEI